MTATTAIAPPAAPFLTGERLARLLMPAVAVAVFLGAWEAAVRLLEIPVWLLPKPSDFLGRMAAEYPLLLAEAWATSQSIALGFMLGIAVAVPLALALVSIPALERGLYPVIVFLNIMPKTVIGPILIVWFGVNQMVVVLIVFLMCFFPILVDSMAGFRATDPRLAYITRSMGATGWQAFRHVRLPAAMTYIAAGMRIGIVKAIEGVIIAEFIGSSAGLGFMILRASGFMDQELMFSGLIATAIVALLFNAAVLAAEYWMMPWTRGREMR